MRRQKNVLGGHLFDWFESMRSDYRAAKTSRYRRSPSGLLASGSSADYHYRSEADYLRMMELARELYRNNGVIGQGIDRLADNVIQDGFTPDPQTGDDGLNRELSARWAEWSTSADQCDLSSRFDWRSIERLAIIQTIVDGDLIALPTSAGSLELVEAHRLRTPRNTSRNVVHGVLLDEHRRPLEYWLTRDEIEPSRALTRVRDVKAYSARDEDGNRAVFHIYDPRRVSQTRGVTALAPSVDQLSMGDDLFFAMLVKAQHGSVYSIFHEFPDTVDPPLPAAKGEQRTETQADGTTRVIEGVAPGMEVFGTPGEKLHGFSPNIPNPEFFPHAKLILTLCAINIGLPLAVFLLDPSETNFSGWRGAIDQARLGFRRIQRNLTGSLHRHVWGWKLRQWAASDAAIRSLAAKSAIRLFAHRWNPPTWPYIEPLKDASADLLRTRNALISQRRRAAERSMDWDDLSTEIVEDNAKLIEKAWAKAEELNKRFPGLNVSWREVASLPTPDGVTVSVSAQEEQQK